MVGDLVFRGYKQKVLFDQPRLKKSQVGGTFFGWFEKEREPLQELCQEWNLIYCDSKHRSGPLSPWDKRDFQQIAQHPHVPPSPSTSAAIFILQKKSACAQ